LSNRLRVRSDTDEKSIAAPSIPYLKKGDTVEIPEWLAEYNPRVPLEQLVEEVNKIFHSCDAAQYDQEHPEIHQQLPPIWAEMIAQLPPAGPWNVLDFGCGTGFEATLALGAMGDRIAKLTAYDPSPEMMAICKIRLKEFPQAVFCSKIEEARCRGPFSLLLTNSLLHHLPNIGNVLQSLATCLTPGAVWLAGHEPSARFFRNQACLRLLDGYRRYRKYAKWVEPGNYMTKLRMILGLHPLSTTANAAYKRGLFSKRPTPSVIDKIVDFHVAHSAGDGRGLDFEMMETSLQFDWTLRWSKTYSFLGPFGCASAPRRWAQKAHQLERQFPSDGANFCAVWQRSQGSQGAPSI
jgi:SAM-dependent methyltransferase